MKTLQEQYNLIQEGKGHKDMFLKSARRLFPEYVTNFSSFEEATKILKQKSILSEGIGGIVTQKSANPFINWDKFLAEEAKAEEKKPTKEVVDTETAGYDYKDPKNPDNLNFEEMLRGYYAELKDPKNADKTETELREMVAKNLAKDSNYYVKDGVFGVKGAGYTDQAPGLKVSDKELKGEYASSGMEEVKINENMPKLTDLLNEAIGGYIDLHPVGMSETKSNKDEEVKEVEKKRPKKDTTESKLAEIEKAGKITTLEAQIDALSEIIEGKTQRLSLVSEDESLSELMDKKKIKDMQREIKDLERKKVKMEKLYEKMSGGSYSKKEVVDETEE